MSPVTASSQKPSHSDIVKIISNPGDFASYSISQVDLPPKSLLTRLGSPPMTLANKAYSTVQISVDQHVELNCDFLFVNHSCEPSLEFVVVDDVEHIGRNGFEKNSFNNLNGSMPSPAIEIRVAERKDLEGNKIGLRKGDELTFFYPSTEWEMDQPFVCQCSSQVCKRRISGAKDMFSDQLRGYFLNKHILKLLESRSNKQGID